MITGKLPFSGRDLSEYRYYHQRVEPPAIRMDEGACREWLADYERDLQLYEQLGIPWMPEELAGLVHRCLAKSPEQRFHSFERVRIALANANAENPYETYRLDPPLRRLARQLTESELLSQGLSYIELGRQNLALDTFDELIESYPRNKRGYLEKAKLLLALPDRREEAHATLQQAEAMGDHPYILHDVETFLPKFAEKIVERVLQTFKQAGRVLVVFRPEKTECLVPTVVRTRRLEDEPIPAFSKKLVQECLESGQAWLSRGGNGPALKQAFEDGSVEAVLRSIRSEMGVPLLMGGDTVLGVVYLDVDGTTVLTSSDLAMFLNVVATADKSTPPWLLPLFSRRERE